MDLFYFVFVFAILSCLCHAALWLPCWEMANFLALLYAMFICESVTFLSDMVLDLSIPSSLLSLQTVWTQDDSYCLLP